MYLVDETPWKELLRILLNTALLYEVLKNEIWDFSLFSVCFMNMSEVFESRHSLGCCVFSPKHQWDCCALAELCDPLQPTFAWG